MSLHANETKSISEIQAESNAMFQQTHQILNNLNQLQKTFKESTCFDDEDVKAVAMEIQRFNNEDLQRYRQLNLQRLETLKRFDEAMGFQKNHPALNQYFVKKQKEFMTLCDQYSSKQSQHKTV